ncbi:MAG: hypothetical protein ACK56I_37355, partial [bacterium]
MRLDLAAPRLRAHPHGARSPVFVAHRAPPRPPGRRTRARGTGPRTLPRRPPSAPPERPCPPA